MAAIINRRSFDMWNDIYTILYLTSQLFNTMIKTEVRLKIIYMLKTAEVPKKLYLRNARIWSLSAIHTSHFVH
jgi:hypothetical protein